MNDHQTTPTVGGLLMAMWGRLRAEAQVALLLIALIVLAQYLLFRDLAGSLSQIMAAGGMQDPEAIREQVLPLLRPLVVRNLIIGLVWLLAVTVWAHVLTHGRPLAAGRMAVTFLHILWRSVAMVGWGVLLGIPLAAFYLLLMGLFAVVGVKLSAMQINVLLGGLAVVFYVPLFATYLLAVVETAAHGRTPIHQAFDALGRGRTPYFLASFLLTIAGAVLSGLVTVVLGEGMAFSVTGMVVSAAINGIWLMASLALAAAVHPFTYFASGLEL